MRETTPPPTAVLRAFGANEPPMLLPGGMGGTWRSGDLVLKRSSNPAGWYEWEALVLAAVRTDRVRVQGMRTARDGRFVVNGWVAHDFVIGAHEPRRWPEIIEAGDVFHAALAQIPHRLARPPAVGREDAWAVADRIAWGELDVPTEPAFSEDALAELFGARRPVAVPSQLVHGDLTGNVLFADGMAPGIIDFSPYVRPTAYAVGVVISDAITWEGADLGLLERASGRPGMGQCLIRALIFRHVTALLLPGRLPTGHAARRYAALRGAAIALSNTS
jgi:uncharacterized protein (TIGR02569 family)